MTASGSGAAPLLGGDTEQHPPAKTHPPALKDNFLHMKGSFTVTIRPTVMSSVALEELCLAEIETTNLQKTGRLKLREWSFQEVSSYRKLGVKWRTLCSCIVGSEGCSVCEVLGTLWRSVWLGLYCIFGTVSVSYSNLNSITEHLRVGLVTKPTMNQNVPVLLPARDLV